MAVTTQPEPSFTDDDTESLEPQPSSHMLGVPPGLDYLASVDQLIVKQKIELAEVLLGCEMKNKYDIVNSMQQQVFYCFEESNLLNRLCCGRNRGFVFHIQDNNETEVLTLKRPFKCFVGVPCCADHCCCKYPVFIIDGQGQQLGMMRVTNYCCYPHFGIFDNNDNQLYQITGGCCRCQGPCFCRGDVNFPVTRIRDGAQIANVAKQWAGVIREFASDADTISVTFPMNLPVNQKALLLASVFLVDMTLYEQKPQKHGSF